MELKVRDENESFLDSKRVKDSVELPEFDFAELFVDDEPSSLLKDFLPIASLVVSVVTLVAVLWK